GATIGEKGRTGVDNSGSVTVTDSTVSGNGGRGISNEGSATVSNCTISGNGGGIYNYEHVCGNVGWMSLVNTTVCDNRSSGSGAGVYNLGGTVTLRNCTVAGNAVKGNDPYDRSGGGISSSG